jgi:outer membrane receptor protein involved in Fe transport
MPCAFVLSLFASTALAQIAPAPKPADTVADVVVVGQKAAVKSSIDRKTYNVTRDLAGSNGSVSDVLRNLPSVEVDIEGNVSLRGESSVQILIDGQPAMQMSPQSRAQALQQMAAGSIEAIEVMTNPSAEFSPDGVGGVINLVTKKIRKPGRSGSVVLSAGSMGFWNANVLGAYNDGPLNYSGGFGVRRESRAQPGASLRTRIDPVTGQRSDIDDSGRAQYVVMIMSLSGAVDYDATARDRLSLSASARWNDGFRTGASTEVRRDVAGQVFSDYDAVGEEPYGFANVQIQGGWRHAFAEPGRVLTLTVRRQDVSDDHRNRTAFVYRTPAALRIEQRDTFARDGRNYLTAAYAEPLADGGVFKAGLDLAREDSIAAFKGAFILPGGDRVPMPNADNHFAFTHLNQQAWATWQKPLGKLTVLGGLRLEHETVEAYQTVGEISDDNDYLDVHPSLHLQYDLTEAQKLTFSYSHRVARPQMFQLNPFVRRADVYDLNAGNPDLEPQETHSLEAGWERVGARSSLGATLYLRKNYNVIGDVDRFVSPLVVLHTFENQGTSTTGGLALDSSGKIGDALAFRLSANVIYTEVQRSTLAGGDLRAAYSHTLKGNLDWRPTDKDFVQLSGTYGGKQLTSQGYTLPTGTLNLGYRRQLRPDLVVTATVSDLLETGRRGNITDTPTLFGRGESYSGGRIFILSLTRQLGGKPAKEAAFDYVS